MKVVVQSNQPINVNQLNNIVSDLTAKYAPMNPIIKSVELDVVFQNPENGDLLDIKGKDGNPAVATATITQNNPVYAMCQSGETIGLKILVSTITPAQISYILTSIQEYLLSKDYVQMCNVAIDNNDSSVIDLYPCTQGDLNVKKMYVSDIKHMEPYYYMPFIVFVDIKQDVNFSTLQQAFGEWGHNMQECEALKIVAMKKMS